MLKNSLIVMNSEKKKELASLGFQLVDIKDKEWMLIADQDGFNNSCIVLDSIRRWKDYRYVLA